MNLAIQLKEAHETYLKDIFTSETHRLTKKAWSYKKSQRRDNIGIPPLLNEKGELCEDAEDKAEILSRQYTSVFTQDNPLEPVPDVPYSLPSMPDINIEENGILKLLKEVNVYKAIGPDLIPNRILKDCCVELAPILTQIYKKSLREGRLPQEWLSANVTAIFKKGARHEASNNRPVSLTSVTCKIFEHVLFSQIMRHYTRHKFINPLQHGFQKGLSCKTQLATTVDQLQKRLDDKQQVDLIILDFQKAFDKVPHRHLLHKLHESGIHGQLHEWLTCYLTERTQRVIVDGCESTEDRVMSGVPQGTVLGPLMFLTYINDITCGINGQMRLFADYALLYYPVRTIADGASLQHDLHTLHRWSKSWKMAFNGKKCHVMHVTRNRNITNCSYTLGQDKLTPVSHHPYLGVELDDHLNWKEQTARVRSKGVRMLNMVRRNFTRGTTPTIRCEIYKSLVRPSMEYGSIVWDPHQLTRIKTLEAVQNKGARYVNQDWDRHTSVTTMKKDLGWLTLQERRLVNRLTFLMKSIHNIHGHTLPPHVVKPARALRSRHTN